MVFSTATVSSLRNADAEQRLRYLAYHDALTGLPNSSALLDLGAEIIAAAAADGEGVALVQVDVDACSRIRSMFGPDAGDEALRMLGRILQQFAVSQGTDTRVAIARIDGDRFVICVRDAQAEQRATELTLKITAALEAPVQCAGHQFFLQAIFGMAVFPEHGLDAKTLLTHAGTAKHHAAMTESRGAVTYTNHIGARARERLELGAALREAVRTEQLSLYFQPKIRLSDLSICGVEALLRWNDPVLGEVSPGRFIPLAEESDLNLDIGKWVVQSVCRQLQNWQIEGFFTTAAINVSGKEFLHAEPARTITANAAAAGVDPRSLIVEITYRRRDLRGDIIAGSGSWTLRHGRRRRKPDATSMAAGSRVQ